MNLKVKLETLANLSQNYLIKYKNLLKINKFVQ